MNVLIIGSGGREHALAWKVSQSEDVSNVFVAPGNAGSALEPKVSNVDIGVADIDALIAFAKERSIDLTIVGPEAPLVIGIVDSFTENGLRCFGPSAAAAQLEGSKAFTKDFLAKYEIPTADYAVFTVVEEACNYITEKGAPIVVKADGLAAGKGVIVAETVEQAHLPMATSQDHKARDNGDQGPNTGGMGAYSPAPVVTEELHQLIMDDVILPTVKGMQAEGAPYTGFLYAGLMISADGTPKVIEYNCRFGDPETQPIMMRLKSDLAQLCMAALDKKLDVTTADWDDRAALGIVLAAGGYPDSYAKGHEITGLDNCDTDSCKTFHAGTAQDGDKVITSGGRVLCVTALGNTVTQAQALAYESAEKISWDGVFCRSDIGYRAIARES